MRFHTLSVSQGHSGTQKNSPGTPCTYVFHPFRRNTCIHTMAETVSRFSETIVATQRSPPHITDISSSVTHKYKMAGISSGHFSLTILRQPVKPLLCSLNLNCFVFLDRTAHSRNNERCQSECYERRESSDRESGVPAQCGCNCCTQTTTENCCNCFCCCQCIT